MSTWSHESRSLDSFLVILKPPELLFITAPVINRVNLIEAISTVKISVCLWPVKEVLLNEAEQNMSIYKQTLLLKKEESLDWKMAKEMLSWVVALYKMQSVKVIAAEKVLWNTRPNSLFSSMWPKNVVFERCMIRWPNLSSASVQSVRMESENWIFLNFTCILPTAILECENETFSILMTRLLWKESAEMIKSVSRWHGPEHVTVIFLPVLGMMWGNLITSWFVAL